MTETTTETTEVSDNVSPNPEDTASPKLGEAEVSPSSKLEEGMEPETFPREYVEKLRTENGKYRQRAGEADALAQRLHTELVRATGRLADPTDLAFDEEHLGDPDTMVAAIDELLATKPHLASRRPVGDIGQGNRGPTSSSFSLLDTLKSLT